jgi:hypothetical protein
MSRARVSEVSSPISLFPFIGILLCTMAALLVILIAVSRSAHEAAVNEIAARCQPTDTEESKKASRQMKQLSDYVDKLKLVESDGQRQLREDQLRLSHIEDHIRRLQERLRSIQSAAIELVALEEEHYDDRQQAEREVERLRQLITESEEKIAELKEQADKGKRSYALIPYEGANGTFRRPIYVECVKDAVILQPEGVEISSDALRPPFGPGNPLASALRAAREHLIRLYPREGQSRDTEPYPLLVVRPDGLLMYNRARKAIEDGDFDFGYELVEADWELKYPSPDPALAVIEHEAVQQACIRQNVLAEAAPRAYRHPSLAAAGEFEFDDEAAASGGDGQPGSYVIVAKGSGGGDGMMGGGHSDSAHEHADAGYVGGNSESNAQGGNGGTNGGAQPGHGSSHGDGEIVHEINGTTEGENGGQAAGAPGGTVAGGTASPPMGGQHSAGMVANSTEGGVGMLPDESGQPPTAVSMMTGTPPTTSSDPHGDRNKFHPRGKDWALDRKPPRAVPIQRTIRVVVRENQIAFLPDSGRTDGSAAAEDVVTMEGDTVEAIDEIVAQVRERIQGWGLAGDGLYWRPVLVLNVGPNAQRRASDLARLLKNSGLEIRAAETARKPVQGDDHETR